MTNSKRLNTNAKFMHRTIKEPTYVEEIIINVFVTRVLSQHTLSKVSVLLSSHKVTVNVSYFV